jgi:hypothetical protein
MMGDAVPVSVVDRLTDTVSNPKCLLDWQPSMIKETFEVSAVHVLHRQPRQRVGTSVKQTYNMIMIVKLVPDLDLVAKPIYGI